MRGVTGVMFFKTVCVVFVVEIAARLVVVNLLGLEGEYLLIIVPLTMGCSVLAGKWTIGALARAQGQSYRADPVERLWMRLQLRRQLRQLKK